jgi:galactokinase
MRTALALTGLYRVPVPRLELAALARRAENEFAGVPTGIMDQIAALLGRAGHALLLDCRTGTGTAVPLDPAAAGLTLHHWPAPHYLDAVPSAGARRLR